MVALLYNLYVERGSSFQRTFSFNWAVANLCDAPGNTGQLHVDPLPVAISAGFLLEFDCTHRLVTAQDYTAGETMISVTPFPGALAAGAKANGPAIDLSGNAYSCLILASSRGSVIAAPTVLGGATGLTISLDASQTLSIPANIRRGSLPQGDPELVLQNPDSIPQIFLQGYPYQVQEVGGQDSRVIEGRVFVAEGLS